MMKRFVRWIFVQQEQLVRYTEDIFQLFTEYREKTNLSFSELVQIWVDINEQTKISNELAAFCHQLDDRFSDDALSREDIRKLLQYMWIRREQDLTVESLHMTPDAVCVFMSYLVQRFTNGHPMDSIMDPAVGSANLLTAVLNGFAEPSVQHIYGVDISKTALPFALISGDLQSRPIQLILGDYLQVQVPMVSCIVCELPTGYYTDAEWSQMYRMNRTDTLSYIHELYIEKMLSHVQPGGFLFLLIPNDLFERDQKKALHQLIVENAHIQALLQLPDELFQRKRDRKSIFVLQKKGGESCAPKQVMLVQIPSFQKKEGFEHILFQMNQWFQEQKN